MFIPGQHDEFARRYLAHSFGGVEVLADDMHTLADGRVLWLIDGDHLDGVIACARWLAYLGDMAYGLVLEVKRAVSHVSHFETAVAREARKRGADGVVCGHIHHAEMRLIEGVLYCNDGDWVESLTALVEHPDGRLEIIDHSVQQQPATRPMPGPAQPSPAAAASTPARAAASDAITLN